MKMWRYATVGATVVALAGSMASALAGTPETQGWPQWGGVSRDFKSNVTGLAERWPDDGPRPLWRRPLGEGYSPIVADRKTLYTMYREGGDEVVIALSSKDGQTRWEHRYPVEPYEGQTGEFGQGPNASPLILGDRLITVGFTGILHCLDIQSGKPHWSRDLVKDFNGRPQYYGYANSPLAYRGTVILPVGGDGYGVVALDPDTGSLVWKSGSSDISYAAPVIINVDGQDQFVYFTPETVVGLDAKSGAFLWSHPVVNFCKTNCTSVIWGKDNLLWAATKGVGGTRVLRLTQRDGKTSVKEQWIDRKIRIYHWNAVRVGDYVYTSSGQGKKTLSVIDVKTGKITDQHRGFGSTNGVYADGKLILLDDSGRLVLAKVLPKKLEIISSAEVLDSVSWTPPTLVGRTLFVRDRHQIVALDLG